MTDNAKTYEPGPAAGARIDKQGDDWTLVLTRELRHSPDMIWEALTDPAQLSQWAPFDANRSLAAAGPVALSTVGTPSPQVSETSVRQAIAPKLLEYNWGGQELRWEIEPFGQGARLMLWHKIDNRFIVWGAAGWHICFDVLDRLLDGHPMGRMVGPPVMQLPAWQRLLGEYTKLFGMESK